MSDKRDDSLAFIIIFIFAGLCLYIGWLFSQTFGLDMETSGRVILRLLVLAVLFGASLYCGSSYSWDMFKLGNTWPILLGVFWMSWWPALDYWAAKEIQSLFGPNSSTIWWAAWYTKFGGLVGFVGGGYLIKKMFED